MKLLNYKKNNENHVGVKTGKGIVNLQKAVRLFQIDLPDNMMDIIKNNALSNIKRLVDWLESKNYDSSFYEDTGDIEFLPVVLDPEKIVCVGLNYLSHVEEAKITEMPKTPVLFSKFNNALAAHNEFIPLPEAAEKFDYEAELVIVIGKEAKNIPEKEALSYVFGYSIGNDLSARDLQFTSSQWLLGKSLDSFAPVGPYLVADEVDPSNLQIETKVNGEIRQSSNTKYMIFNCAAIISYISRHMTLKPGDLIFTGTPEGVIFGFSEDKQEWLRAGDVIEITIQNIGTLKNTLK